MAELLAHGTEVGHKDMADSAWTIRNADEKLMTACFNVSSGDVEDAPALDPLAKFDVYERNGAVYIKGEEKVIKANKRALNIKCNVKGGEHVVIIGRQV
jgi:hypothetical protein